MKAMLTDENRNFVWADVPTPTVKENEVLIEVYAAALNRADLMQRAGDYPPPPGCPPWMGLEVSGIIKEMGAVAKENSNFKIGDKVCTLLGGGGYAEYVTTPYDMLMPIPKGLSLTESAALPEAFATAYLNLFWEGDAKKGNTLLMHAGASGLASVIIPMAKTFGLRVITSVLTADIAKSIAHLKADVVINTSSEKVADRLKIEEEQGHPVNIAIDCLGGDMLGECFPFVARGCRWIIIATLAGDTSRLNMKTMYMKGIRLIGSTLRSKPPEVKAQILSELIEKVWPKVESGEVRPTIYKTLPITEVEAAHAVLEHGENVGKVVLIVKEN